MDVELDGEPQQVTHLGLVMVDPDVQGQGLSWVLYGLTTLVLFARDGLRPKWISNVTQVPSVVAPGRSRARARRTTLYCSSRCFRRHVIRFLQRVGATGIGIGDDEFCSSSKPACVADAAEHRAVQPHDAARKLQMR